MQKLDRSHPIHSSAWVAQVWISFVISLFSMSAGILYAPVNSWVKGYLAMGLLFSVGSSISLAKTTRDLHEANQLISRIDSAKIQRILAEHNPLNG